MILPAPTGTVRASASGTNDMTNAPKTYTVGYGKPPEATKFKKGHCPNRKGRRKDSVEIASLVEKAAQQLVTVQENGTRKRIPKIQAAITQLINRATTGDQRAIKLMTDLINLGGAAPSTDVPQFTLTDVDREVLNQMIARAQQKDDGSTHAD
jgi:Family of unknown function (DUF5681)